MALDQVGDIVRVTIAWQYPDQQVLENNIAYRCSAAAAVDSRGALGNAVRTIFLSVWLPHVSNQVNLYGYKVSALNKMPSPAPVTGVIVTMGVGTSGIMPTQARPLLKLRTALAGRKYRGRLFLPTPILDDITASGYPTAGLNTDTGLIGTGIINPISVSGSTWTAVIAHLVKGNPLATTTTDITSAIPAGLFGTMRKSGNTGRINATPW